MEQLKIKDKTSKFYPIRRFLAGDVFALFVMAFGLVFVCTDQFVLGSLIFSFLFSVVIILSDDMVTAFFPFMILCTFSIQAFNSWPQYKKILPLFMVPILAGVFHGVVYRNKEKTKRGELFLPIAAVSIAVAFGGVGILPWREYFSPVSIVYMFGLGLLMLLVYVHFRGHIAPGKNYTENIDIRIGKMMSGVAAFIFIEIIEFYLQHWDKVLKNHGIIFMQWRNNASTMLMIALPFVFYMASKKFSYIFIAFASVISFVLSGSRSGLVFGLFEFVVLMIFFAINDKKHRKAYIGLFVLMVLGAVIIMPKLVGLMSYTVKRFKAADQYSVRLRHWARAIDDFKANPIFGRGLAYMGNRDVHPSKKGALCWYHNSVLQVIGSFGLTGVIAYLYQAKERVKLLRNRNTLFGKTIFLSILSLELMSLVNPGVFSPLYLLYLTVLLIIAENYIPKKDKGVSLTNG